MKRREYKPKTSMCFKVVSNYQWMRLLDFASQNERGMLDLYKILTTFQPRLVLGTYVPCIQCVCLTNFSGRSTSMCHVTFLKTKMNVNWYLHILLKCHLNVTCLVVHVILISKVPVDVWFFFQQATLHVKC